MCTKEVSNVVFRIVETEGVIKKGVVEVAHTQTAMYRWRCRAS